MLRVVFFGLSRIIEPSVLWLRKNSFPFIIVTNSEQIKKREFSEQFCGENVVLFDDSRELLKYRWEEHDIGISVGAPWFFAEAFINSYPGLALLNLHGSQLPMYRGGNLFSWYVLNNVRVGICLLHHLDALVDQGPFAFYEEFLYPADCKRPVDYIRCYEQNNSRFLLDTLKRIIKQGEPISKNRQPHYLSTYWPRLRSDVNGWIDWDLDGALVDRFISAFDEPYSGAATYWRNKEIRLKTVFFQPGFNHHPFQNGIIFRNNGAWLNIAVQGGELIVCSVYSNDAKLNLSLFKEGDRFFTPLENINEAKKRIIKTNNGLYRQQDIG